MRLHEVNEKCCFPKQWVTTYYSPSPPPSSRIIVGSQVYDMKFVPQHLSTRKLLVLHLRGNYFGKEHITGTLARFEILNRMRTIPPQKKKKIVGNVNLVCSIRQFEI